MPPRKARQSAKAAASKTASPAASPARPGPATSSSRSLASPTRNGAAAAAAAPGSTTSDAAARINAQIQENQIDPVTYRRTPKSLGLVAYIFAAIAVLASTTLYLHYKLPTPGAPTAILASGITPAQAAAYRPRSPVAFDSAAPITSHFSEGNAVSVMHHLAEDIGYRIVGTRELVEAEDWLEEVLRRYEGWHDTGSTDDGVKGRTQVEVWKQEGDGVHRFPFMSSVVWKQYQGVGNLIVRISDGTEESKANSVLLNAHLDSTLPSPGGADDGIGVAILLEALRILTLPGTGRRLRNSVVLLFNGAEESLQDASVLYITQHNETKDAVKAVVNLEAAGTSGPELLFQATSSEMIEAYSTVPYPFATVLANDVFSTGVLLSDTDFRQFVEYHPKGLTGLDMAVVGNSYLYHTRKDVPKYLEPGATQHFGMNTLAIIEHLCLKEESAGLLAQVPHKQTQASLPIYFTLAGRKFFLITARGFKTLTMALSGLLQFQMVNVVRADAEYGALKLTIMSAVGALLSLLAAVVGANGVAFFMVRVLGRGMSWFSHEHAAVLLYAPPALASVLAMQYAMSLLVKPHQRPYFERANLTGMGIFFTLALLALNAFSIGSAYLMALAAGTMLLTMTINDFGLVGFGDIEMRLVAPDNRVSPYSYLAMILIPSTIGAEGMVSFLDLFVPLTGRTGEISPADNIIASIVGALTFLTLPVVLPLAHRYPTATLKRAILLLLSVTAVMVAIFAARSPFDAMHPKRIFVHQVQNLTDGQWYLNLGGVDPAPGFAALANEVQQQLGREGESAELRTMDAYNPDFDILFPVSDFLTPYKFQLPSPPTADGGVQRYAPPASEGTHFRLRATRERIDYVASTRSVTLEVEHPNIIWPVIAFDGDVVEWNLPSPPPAGMQRHHIKQVGRYGVNRWSIHLVLRLSPEALEATRRRKHDDFGLLVTVDPSSSSGIAREAQREMEDGSRLKIDMSGLVVDGMFPQHRKEEGARDSFAMQNFERLDAFLVDRHEEVDAMLLSVVAAVVVA